MAAFGTTLSSANALGSAGICPLAAINAGTKPRGLGGNRWLASNLVRSEQSPMIPCSAELPQAAFDASNFNQSALTGARVGGPAVAKPRDGGFSDGTSTDLPDRDGGAATLFRRSGRLARCAEPDLLLPRSTAVRSHRRRCLPVSGRGKARRHAADPKLAMSLGQDRAAKGANAGAPERSVNEKKERRTS
jgi:hypothetical protein